MKLPHVFISYKHSDTPEEFIRELSQELSDADIPFWRDRDNLRIGMTWSKEIERALDNAFAVLPIITPHAKDSSFMTYEWAYAAGSRTSRVFPIRYEAEDHQIHPKLAELEMLSFQNGARPWTRLIKELQNARAEYSKINQDKEKLIAKKLYEELRYYILDLDRKITALDVLEVINRGKLMLSQDHVELVQLLMDNQQDYDE